jgi:PAS domain S-box-containing protein
MSPPFDLEWEDLRRQVLGLGELSARKSHYPSLRQRLTELERFRAAVDLSGDLLFVIDPGSGAILEVNASACRRLGRTAAELASLRIGSLLPPAAATVLERLFASFGSSGCDQATLDTVLTGSSGEAFPVEIAAHCGTAEGSAYAVLAARDIGERQRAQAALRESEERYRRFVRMSAEGMCRFDLPEPLPLSLPVDEQARRLLHSARLGECNEAFARQCGSSSPDDLLGAAPDAIWSGSAKSKLAILEKFAQAGYLFSDLETWEADARGNPVRWFLNNGVGILRDDKLTCFWLTLRDITERRILEEELRQAQKMEAVGRLAAGVAHDFNNLLTVINGYSALVLEALNAVDPLRDPMLEISRAGERATGVTQQLLAFGRRQKLCPRVLDLNAAVRDAKGMLRLIVGESIELLDEFAPGLAPVEADPSQIQQVILNLAVNARDAMPKGGRLVLRTESGTMPAASRTGGKPVACGVLSVADSGCGMDESTRTRVFEPFFTTKAEGRGTGLGLATVYGIVKQSGGHVEVSSQVGIGTTFRVFLPSVSQPASSDPAASLPSAMRGSEVILLVEDQEDVRRFAAMSLAAQGYTVLQAGRAEEALALCRSHPGPLDVLVTDVGLPGMRGPDLAVEIERVRPGIKTILTSGYPGDVSAQDVNPAVSVHLPKPFTSLELAAKIREVLHP